jgi:GDP-L-galactose phosphorylase
MLSITRSPTVYSLAQLKEEGVIVEGEEEVQNTQLEAIRDIVSKRVHLYKFAKKRQIDTKLTKVRSFGSFDDILTPEDHSDQATSLDTSDNLLNSGCGSGAQDDNTSSDSSVNFFHQSLLDSLILAEWESKMEQGLFRYDVTSCPTHTMGGSMGFIAQLNEGRAAKKRPTEFQVDKVIQAFDDAKFNFCKARQNEILFTFEEQLDEHSGVEFEEAFVVAGSPNLVMINVSPIEYGHILLVPRVLDKLPQLITPDTLLLALQFAHEANNPYFRVGYNSLGAYATINHLHFQAYYLSAAMPLERARTTLITKKKHGRSTIRIERLVDYPVNGLVFESGGDLEDTATMVGGFCQRLAAKNIPHNMLIVDKGARIFVLPNAFSQRKARKELPEDILESQVDPAVFEISGHQLMKRREDYEGMDEEWVLRLLRCACLDEEAFEEVIDLCNI